MYLYFITEIKTGLSYRLKSKPTDTEVLEMEKRGFNVVDFEDLDEVQIKDILKIRVSQKKSSTK